MTTVDDQKVPRHEVVRLTGELDLDSARWFGPLLRRVGAGPSSPRLVVDLRAVTFMDCIPLRALCEVRARCLAAGGWVRLVYTRPSIGRLLDVTDLGGEFPRYATIGDACRNRPEPTPASASPLARSGR
ncbi:STAS domain-containing protein [Actinacidiphila sp. ITFR-21]|uniref:STAS domain-containing protein n=1 Tax=Actinacidiphila sp. ITFR-21 TaxID=3075199 RepID=UPI00288C1413|nr:STAS domain-containing protein [Streptomyces sp. ITFR-21]WNI16423.1 STAS domain-containing protein [Streptomyces sp. ITFR-21]